MLTDRLHRQMRKIHCSYHVHCFYYYRSKIENLGDFVINWSSLSLSMDEPCIRRYILNNFLGFDTLRYTGPPVILTKENSISRSRISMNIDWSLIAIRVHFHLFVLVLMISKIIASTRLFWFVWSFIDFDLLLRLFVETYFVCGRSIS